MKQLVLIWIVALLLSACVTSVPEKNPNVSFLNQKELQELLPGKAIDTDGAVTTFGADGKVEICVKAKNKCFNGRWSVRENGAIQRDMDSRSYTGYLSNTMEYYPADGGSPQKWVAM